MSERYFISDTHFRHSEIIAFSERPFYDTNDMDEYMIEKWNSIVSSGDEVIFGGDFALVGKEESARICNSLNGRKILIRGNHDGTKKRMTDIGFSEVHSHLPMLTEHGRILVVHKPHPWLENAAEYSYVLYGHMHHKRIRRGNWLSTCVERNEYRPQTLEQLIER